ncbi:hypothetical protein [Haloarcula sp. JP-L23]|uniref:hypothetical protein n=1 Tax=Haloarcula sp. JP-L23 TaxID=2716717 RepID=UPI00140F0BCC|nr:hypothetical protein G9465_23130 [Haloarcula sp. JP-L23]
MSFVIVAWWAAAHLVRRIIDSTPLTETVEFVYGLPRIGLMRVPARMYGSPELIEEFPRPC